MQKGTTTNRGTAPGSLIFTGKKKVENVKICVFDYDANTFSEKELGSLDELAAFKDNNKVSWLNITGLHDAKTIEKVGEVFGLHPLVMEDILNVQHSPKIDNYDEYLFVIAKMIDLNALQGPNIEQVSFILGKNYLITFQEDEKDLFNSIRDRLRNGIGRVRKLGADYLLYRLLDTIVDNYFLILDNYDSRIEKLEDKVVDYKANVSISSIHILRKEIAHLKRAVLPLRDTIYSLQREKDTFITKNTGLFLRDLADHLKHFVDSLEAHRDAMNSIMDLYFSNSSVKLNEIIKFLTIISTIFIPLTFIVGVYGMNFHNMPELSWRFGYPAVMLLMFAIAVSLIFYFKRKKWF